MKYLNFTHVDSLTGISVVEEVAKNGPAMPAVEGLEFGFALESQYPTSTPTFYGTAPDKSSTEVPGVLGKMNEAEYQEALAVEMLDRKSIATGRALDQLADMRYAREIEGVTSTDGIQQWTDRANRALLTDKISFMSNNPGINKTSWKARNGFVQLDVEGLKELQSLVGFHVDQTYKAENAVSGMIVAAETIEDLLSINIADEFEIAFSGS